MKQKVASRNGSHITKMSFCDAIVSLVAKLLVDTKDVGCNCLLGSHKSCRPETEMPTKAEHGSLTMLMPASATWECRLLKVLRTTNLRFSSSFRALVR